MTTSCKYTEAQLASMAPLEYKLLDSRAEPPYMMRDEILFNVYGYHALQHEESKLIPTGVAIKIPPGYRLRVLDKLPSGCFRHARLSEYEIHASDVESKDGFLPMESMQSNFSNDKEPYVFTHRSPFFWVRLEKLPEEFKWVDRTKEESQEQDRKPLPNLDSWYDTFTDFDAGEKKRGETRKGQNKETSNKDEEEDMGIATLEEGEERAKRVRMTAPNPLYEFDEQGAYRDANHISDLHSWYKQPSTFNAYLVPHTYKQGRTVNSPDLHDSAGQSIYWHFVRDIKCPESASDKIKTLYAVVERHAMQMDRHLSASESIIKHRNRLKTIVATAKAILEEMKTTELEPLSWR